MKSIKDIRRERLDSLVSKHGGQSALAEKIGKDRNQVHQWLLPDENPNSRNLSDKTARHIESVFDLPAGWLDTQDSKIHAYQIRGVDRGDGVNGDTEVMVPVVDVELGAGDGVALEFVETKYRLPYQIEWLRSMGVKDPADVLLMNVRGHSMETNIWDGDKILIHLKNTKIVSDAVYAIMLDGEPRVKRLFKSADSIRVVSDNEDKVKYPDEFISSESAERLVIIGRAIHKQGSKGL